MLSMRSSKSPKTRFEPADDTRNSHSPLMLTNSRRNRVPQPSNSASVSESPNFPLTLEPPSSVSPSPILAPPALAQTAFAASMQAPIRMYLIRWFGWPSLARLGHNAAAPTQVSANIRAAPSAPGL